MKADRNNTTMTGRRVLLGTAAAAIGAGIAASLPAVAAELPDANEAGLIRLCNRLGAIRAEQTRAFATMPQTTIDEEHTLDALLAPGRAEWRGIEDRIYELDITPRTPAGISAMARAALAEAERDLDGEIATYSLDEYLAFTVIEAIEPDASAVLRLGVASRRPRVAS